MRTDSLFYRHRDDPDPDLSEKFFVGMYCGIPADYRVQPVLRLIMKRNLRKWRFLFMPVYENERNPRQPSGVLSLNRLGSFN